MKLGEPHCGIEKNLFPTQGIEPQLSSQHRLSYPGSSADLIVWLYKPPFFGGTKGHDLSNTKTPKVCQKRTEY
jgi:hypothetical protein